MVYELAVKNTLRKDGEGTMTYIARVAAAAECRVLPLPAKQLPREPGEDDE